MLLPLLIGLSVMAAQEPPLPTPEPEEPPAAVTTTEGDALGAQAEINLGIQEYLRRRFARAEEHFSRALEVDPNSAASAYYLGYVIYKKVEFRRNHPDKNRAKELFTKAFTLDPSFRPTWKRQ